jgi:hypothetical protein
MMLSECAKDYRELKVPNFFFEGVLYLEIDDGVAFLL